MVFYCTECKEKKYPDLNWPGFDYCKRSGHQINSTLQKKLTGVKWEFPKETGEQFQSRIKKCLKKMSNDEEDLKKLCIDLIKDGCSDEETLNGLLMFEKSSSFPHEINFLGDLMRKTAVAYKRGLTQ